MHIHVRVFAYRGLISTSLADSSGHGVFFILFMILEKANIPLTMCTLFNCVQYWLDFDYAFISLFIPGLHKISNTKRNQEMVTDLFTNKDVLHVSVRVFQARTHFSYSITKL